MSRPRYGERFEVLELLGEGAMGKVYRARDLELGREVALKVVPARKGATGLERFRREGEVTASLRHPGIVGVHSFGEEGDEAYLAYELIPDARTLRDAMKEVDTEAGLRLLIGAAEALGYAHSQGVTHRDVKPDNILITPEDEPKVADFGLAMAQGQERLTRTGALVGTPYYMAPEQFDQSKKADVGPATDVWALGVILFEILTGKVPFEADSILELGAKIMRAKPQAPSNLREDLPRELDTIYRKALRAEPSERYADGQAMADDLTRFLEGRRLSAEHEAWVGKRRAGGIVAVGILVALAAAGAVRLTSEEEQQAGPQASARATSPQAAPRRVVCEWRLEQGQEARQVELNFDEQPAAERVEGTLRRVNLSLEGEVPLAYDTDADSWLPLNAVLGRTWSSTPRGPLEGLAKIRQELGVSLVDAAPPVQALVQEAFDEPQLRRHLTACRALGRLDGSSERRLAIWPSADVGLSCAVSVTREGEQLKGRLTEWERLGSGAKVREPELTFSATLAEGKVVRAELNLAWRASGAAGSAQERFRLRYAVQTVAGAAPTPTPN